MTAYALAFGSLLLVGGRIGDTYSRLGAYGTSDQVQEQLKPWDHAADIVTILLPPGITWHNIEATLVAAAPGTAAKTDPKGLAAAAG